MIGGAASRGYGAVQLSSMSDPTLETLIAMGSTPVDVGPYQFNNFSFVDASSGATYTPGEIQVQAFNSNGYGLEFVSNWFASNGTMVDNVITYDVSDTTSAQPIAQVNLLSNGTAPEPVTGTFATTSLIASIPRGSTAAPELSTYNQGSTASAGQPNVNYAYETLTPQPQLSIIDTIFAISTPAGVGSTGGVATASVLQNSFAPASVPEPALPVWILLPMLGAATTGRRSRHQV